MRLILASASPARLQILRRAGLRPDVIVSGADESQVVDPSAAGLALARATLKGEAVGSLVDGEAIVVGCDSALEFEGQVYGKPRVPEVAAQRWRLMRGRSGVLHTGHWVQVTDGSGRRSDSAVASTTVHFADLTDGEIDAYVATGEPLAVAGAFTVDGLGGPFVSRIDGDYHNVVGLSLPLLRTLLLGLGVPWPRLWDLPVV